MARRRSTRSCSRARTSERGFALAVALIVAVLYFAMIQLMLFDASRELAEARRFRARVIAATLAENAAELAAASLTDPNLTATPRLTTCDEQGSMTRQMTKAGEKFTIEASGRAEGTIAQQATVTIQGNVVGTAINIDYTFHSQ
jgi:hypothetical protein